MIMYNGITHDGIFQESKLKLMEDSSKCKWLRKRSSLHQEYQCYIYIRIIHRIIILSVDVYRLIVYSTFEGWFKVYRCVTVACNINGVDFITKLIGLVIFCW